MLKTIKSKLIFIVAVLVGAILFMGVYSIKSLGNVNDKSTEISKQWVPAIIYSEELNTMISDFRVLENDHIISTNVDMMREKERKIEEKYKENRKISISI